MITEDDMQRYAKCMELIKKRIKAIDAFLIDGKTTTYPQTNREFIYLQFRFTFELIALSSLCSHRLQYEQINAQFRKEWNASKIIKGIRRINPHFFPIAIVDQPAKDGEIGTIEFVREGVLTESDLESGIGTCGDNLHQYNPYTGFKDVDPQIERTRFLDWRDRIIRLLNTHLICLAGEDKVLRVVMNTIPGGNVTVQNLDIIRASELV